MTASAEEAAEATPRRSGMFAPGMALAAASVASLLALAAYLGAFETWLAGRFHARIELRDIVLPEDFGLDVERLSNDLADILAERAVDNTAVRFALNEDERQKLAEIVLPRVLNAGALQQIIARQPDIGPIAESVRWQSQGIAEIANRGEEALEDVVLTLPGLVRAEGGDPVTAEGPGGEIFVGLGTLAPGEARRLTLWFDRSADALLGEGDRIRLGAAGGTDGRVALTGAQGWTGAGLETFRLGRWLVMGVLAATGLLTALAAGLLLAPRWR